MLQARWAWQGINIRDVKIFFEVEDAAKREEHVQASQKTQALGGKKPAGRHYIGLDPGKEPLSWHLRPGEVEELTQQWVGFHAAAENGHANYQAVLEFFM